MFRGVGELLLHHDGLTNLFYGQPPRADHPVLHDITAIGREVPLYEGELVGALAEHPETTFVWAHLGFSRRVQLPDHAAHVRRLLERFSNLHGDLSWLVFDTLVCPGGVPDDAWPGLVEAHSDRLCLGSDLFGRFGRLASTMARFTPLLDALSDEARVNLSVGTARRLYDRPALTEPM